MGRLDNRVAIVTGAAHGERAALGSHFAKALAAEGAKVTLADLKDCASVAAEIESSGGEALSVRADVRDEQSLHAMAQATLERFGRIDILVNNAALGSNIPPVPVLELEASAWDEMYAVNVRGPFLCVKAVLPQMRRQKYGKVINIGQDPAHRARVFGPRMMQVHVHVGDVLGGLVFLASAESDRMTGQCLMIDPGSVCL